MREMDEFSYSILVAFVVVTLCLCLLMVVARLCVVPRPVPTEQVQGETP